MRRISALGTALLAVGCAAETSSPAILDHVEIVRAPTGGVLGRPLDSLVILRLVDDRGASVGGTAVTWTVLTGGGSITPTASTTSADGLFMAAWRLGLTSETQRLQVVAGDLPPMTLEVTAAMFRAKGIVLGDGFGCGIDGLGDAWCWGAVEYSYPVWSFGVTPVKVDSGHALVEIVAGGDHACARSTTTTYCWGRASAVGEGPGTPGSGYVASAPVVGGHQFVALTATGSGFATCGLDVAGQGWCWGMDIDGSLGSAAGWSTTATTPIPIDQMGASFVELSLGYDHGCGREADGSARCWGRDRFGKLGDTLNSNSVVPRAIPVTTALRFTHIRTGDDTSCGTTNTGATWCWGANTFSGELTGGAHPWLVPGVNFTPPVIQWQRWGAIRTGRPYFWGRLDVNDFPVPGLSMPTPAELPGEVTGVVQLVMSFQTVCARRADDVVLCWGYVPGVNGPYGIEATGTPVAIPAP